jgi:hypothetical protein
VTPEQERSIRDVYAGLPSLAAIPLLLSELDAVRKERDGWVDRYREVDHKLARLRDAMGGGE